MITYDIDMFARISLKLRIDPLLISITLLVMFEAILNPIAGFVRTL